MPTLRAEKAKLLSLNLSFLDIDKATTSTKWRETSCMTSESMIITMLVSLPDVFPCAVNLILVTISRSLWGRESELSAEIERLKSEVVKAEKSLDHATPGVSA